MAIYTKTGDKGETSLANGTRVSKTDVRVEAYGTVDELNSWIGLLTSMTESSSEPAMQQVSGQLLWIQNKLFNMGAELSAAPGEWIADADIKQLEVWIDTMQNMVPKQKGFLLPTGSVFPVSNAAYSRIWFSRLPLSAKKNSPVEPAR